MSRWIEPEEQARLSWQDWLTGGAVIVGAFLALGLAVQLVLWLTSSST